jgi:hypothetical protein
MDTEHLPPFRPLAAERHAELRAQLRAAVRADTHRSRTRRRLSSARVLVPVAALLAAALALAAPALGLREQIADLFTLGKENRPVPAWSLPGEPTPVPAIAVEFARRAGVDPATLREVAAAGSGANRRLLLAGQGPDGTIWVAFGGAGLISPFRPLASVIEEWTVLGGGTAPAMIKGVSAGGAEPTTVDHVEVIGFVRSDVARVTAVLSDGAEQEVPLNRWRGFGLSVEAQESLPSALRAFDAEGRLLEESPLHVGPLCGGAAGPCDEPTP